MAAKPRGPRCQSARLRELAEQDARIVRAEIMDDIVTHDEWLQTRLRQAIQQLQA